VRPRSPARSRFLGLWTAGWLAVLLVLGIVRFGDPAVQWPVLLVPTLWAAVALRPRHGTRAREEQPRRRRRPEPEPEWEPEPYDEDPVPYDEDPPPLLPGMRTDTVERPALRRPYDPREDDRW
jgi:hypothetical protein